MEAVDSKYLLYGNEACRNFRDGTELIGLRAGGDPGARYPKVLVIAKCCDATLARTCRRQHEGTIAAVWVPLWTEVATYTGSASSSAPGCGGGDPRVLSGILFVLSGL